MKLLNIFKKRKKDSTKSTVQPLDKKQLEKVIGGGDTKSIGSIGNADTAINLRL